MALSFAAACSGKVFFVGVVRFGDSAFHDGMKPKDQVRVKR